MSDKIFFYVIHPTGSPLFNHLHYEVFETREAAVEHAKKVDMLPGTEWLIVEGKLIGFALDDAIDWGEKNESLL